MSTATDFLRTVLYQKSGPLTLKLRQKASTLGLGRLPERLEPDATTDVVCGFCSTGCGLRVHLKDSQAVNATPSVSYPVNEGMACPKGWEALAPLSADDRATTPYLRGEDGQLHPVKWDEALDVFVSRFKAIQAQHGPDSVAFLSTGQIPSEEMALLGAVAKFGMGFRHGDGNTRQCMATSVVAYKQSFGFDAPPFTYADFEESDVLVFVGANPCIAHPILWKRVCDSRQAREIVVIDPRRTETAMAATMHLPIQPKSDLVLLYAVAAALIERGAIDREFIAAHTEGFDAFAAHVAGFPLEEASRVTGLPLDTLRRLVTVIAEGRRVSFWWTMGVNQSHEAVRTAQAIINLALMTGNIGKPGTGANSITGQVNAMGSRLFSNTTSLFGGRDFRSADDRSEVAGILDIDVACVPDSDSLAYDQILEGVRQGRIKGLWIIATNPAHSWIDRGDFGEALWSKLDFLVVQDMYHSTETARVADLMLPAAGWGEKEGTVINSERRLGLFKKVSRAPGEALADFSIFRLVAERWGCGEMFRQWSSPPAVFQILKRLSKGRPCDITGIEDYAMLDREGGVQWPYPAGDPDTGNPDTRSTVLAGTVSADTVEADTVEADTVERARPGRERRLFEDGRFFHQNGRARFLFEAPRPVPEPCDERYPFTLLTGRGSSAQWHTNTRTGKSAVLRKLYPRDVYVEMNIEDARLRGIHEGSEVEVATRRGLVKATAVPMPGLQPRQLFMSMHYEETNRLTLNVVDPYSRQPSYKACAADVRVGEGEAA